MRRLVQAVALTVGVLVLAASAAACGSTGADPDLDAGASETSTPATPPPAEGSSSEGGEGGAEGGAEPGAETEPEPVEPPLVPELADDAEGLAAQIEAAETAIRDPDTTDDEIVAEARLQQVAYRHLAARPDWHEPVIAALPEQLREAARLQVDARLEFTSMNANPPENVPAWRIAPPAPADELRSHYDAAEAEFGIEWEYLAAINLVETGMGRIHGDSSAGAQGPMQFIPSTWERFGEGDVRDPHDAIQAAARYLAHNGGAEGNIDGALFNYNNDVRYVRGVTAYARIMQADPATYRGFHQWQIWYASAAGDLVLPEGYHLTEAQPAADYAAQHPTRLRP